MYTSVSIINNLISFVLKAVGFSILSISISTIIYKKFMVLRTIVRKKTGRISLFKKKVKTIIISPIIEELIFRYQIYEIIYLLDVNEEEKKIFFLILSSFVFTFSHIPKTARLFFEKMIVGGLLYSYIYIVYKDVLLSTIIHMFHNFYIVLIQETEGQGIDYD